MVGLEHSRPGMGGGGGTMHTPSSVEVKMLGNLHVQYTCMYLSMNHLAFYVLQTIKVNIKYHDDFPCLPPLIPCYALCTHQERN